MKTTHWMAVSVAALLLVWGAVSGAAAQEKQVGLMWIGKSNMTKRVATGFLHRMEELAPQIKVVRKIQLPNIAEAERVFEELEASADGVVFLRSSGAMFLGKAGCKKACFVGSCDDPKALGAVRHPEAPEGKITGVTYHIPFEKRFDALTAVFPKVKSLALLAQRGDPATLVEQAGTRAQCQKRGIVYHEVIAYDVNELVEGMEAIADKVDLFVIASTGLSMDNVAIEAQTATPRNKPLFSYAAGRTKAGATAELAGDDLKLGGMLAESVIEVVGKGTPIKSVPVRTDPDPKLLINETMMEKLGLEIPQGVLGTATVVR
ncbi:MAG: ABC transporter substrate binding protein [Thermodesulfobacteriota bacterium]